MSDLTFNEISYTFDQLHSSNQNDWPLPNWHNLSSYEKHVVSFCQAWLSGQETFQLRTSGSTGPPKTIVLYRQQMRSSAHLTGQALGLSSGEHALVCLSAEYIAGVMMLVRGLESGLRMTVITPTRRPLANLAAQPLYDFTAMVPLQLQETLQGSSAERNHLNRMKAILIGGAPISTALDQALQACEAPIYHTYGMTETVSHIALRKLNGPAASDYFTPLPGVSLGLDERSCLHITAPMTRGERLQTNDLVDLQADGRFRWLGRVDNIINSGGVKVQVELVEAALEQILLHYQGGKYAPRRFFVGAIPHDQFGQMVAAVIEGDPFPHQVETDIWSNLQTILPKYHTPRLLYFFPHLQETPTGKIDRRANVARLREELDASQNLQNKTQ